MYDLEYISPLSDVVRVELEWLAEDDLCTAVACFNDRVRAVLTPLQRCVHNTYLPAAFFPIPKIEFLTEGTKPDLSWLRFMDPG